MTAASFSAVFFEDRFVTPSEARVAITDAGYLLGEGVFATLRGYHGACFRPERHLATLVRGAEAFGMTLPIPLGRLLSLVDEAAARTGAPDAYVRVTLARATGDAPPRLSVLGRPYEVPSEADYATGIPAATVARRRIPPACMDATVKTTSYAPQLLARREAEGQGAREGIQLAVDGSLACGVTSNLFLVMGDTLLTPSLESGCRAGITREAIMELAMREGLAVREERIDPSALLDADEAFLTSTRLECLAIASIDQRPIGRAADPTHPRARALRAALRALVELETRSRGKGSR